MKLSGLHVLMVEDLGLPLPVSEAEEEGSDDTEEKDTDLGAKKNENSPAAHAYRSTGMSQQEIANKSGLSKAEISKYKSKDPNVHRDPSIKSLKRLATAGVNIKQMLPDVFK